MPSKKGKKMDNVFYKQQIERLKSQWPHAYSEERMVIFYNAFRNVSNFDFRDAVTDCIANCKGAPLMKELTETISKVITIRKQKERMQSFNPLNDVWALGESKSTADPEFVLKCKELKYLYETKQISKKDFLKACDDLDIEAAELCKKKGIYVDPKEIDRTIQSLAEMLGYTTSQKPY